MAGFTFREWPGTLTENGRVHVLRVPADAVSKDQLHWAHLPIALTPDHPYDCGGEFSGSATVVPPARPRQHSFSACHGLCRMFSLL